MGSILIIILGKVFKEWAKLKKLYNILKFCLFFTKNFCTFQGNPGLLRWKRGVALSFPFVLKNGRIAKVGKLG
jgi:hypothetical protein